jgi:ABC-type sulfate transport system permease component
MKYEPSALQNFIFSSLETNNYSHATVSSSKLFHISTIVCANVYFLQSNLHVRSLKLDNFEEYVSSCTS